MRTLTERIRVWRAPLVAPACTILASCEEGVLAPKGPIGQAEKTILFDATAVMLAVVIPLILLTLAFAWWYRAGNTPDQTNNILSLAFGILIVGLTVFGSMIIMAEPESHDAVDGKAHGNATLGIRRVQLVGKAPL